MNINRYYHLRSRHQRYRIAEEWFCILFSIFHCSLCRSLAKTFFPVTFFFDRFSVKMPYIIILINFTFSATFCIPPPFLYTHLFLLFVLLKGWKYTQLNAANSLSSSDSRIQVCLHSFLHIVALYNVSDMLCIFTRISKWKWAWLRPERLFFIIKPTLPVTSTNAPSETEESTKACKRCSKQDIIFIHKW